MDGDDDLLIRFVGGDADAFAAALVAAERYRPGDRPALAWLYGIAHKLAAVDRRLARTQLAATGQRQRNDRS